MTRPLDRFFYGKPAKPGKSANSKAKPARETRSSRPGEAKSAPSQRRTSPAARPWQRLPLAPTGGRLRVLLIVVAVVFSLAGGRAVQVQAVDAEAEAVKAANEMTVSLKLPAFRGEIADRNGEVLAFTEPTVTVIADPEMIRTHGKFSEPMNTRDQEIAATAPAKIAALMAQHLGGAAEDYLPGLTTGKRYSIVARNVSAASYANLMTAMSQDGQIGIHRESAPTRRYVNGPLAANILGYVNKEGKASGGLELALNSTLSGKDGIEEYETSPNGKIPLGQSELVPAQNGQDYRLTIDAGLQWQVERVIASQVRLTEAVSGTVVVMNSKTGEVLALANFPSFDPNDYGSFDPRNLGNRAVTDVYEPGSVQKVLTFAAMLDSGAVRPTDVVEVPGQIKSGNNTVKDAWNHKTETYYAQGVLAKSSNVGTILLSRRMKTADLQAYLASFGLGKKTGIGLPGESAGILPGPDMPDYSRDGLAFGGSAVAVTAIQEAAAVAAVTNGGIYNQPRIIASTTLPDGTVADYPTAQPRRVISASASKDVVALMEGMVTNNTAGTFVVPGYRTGAKTGTAQKLDPKTGARSGILGSVIGVGPVEDPQILVYVVIDNPKRGNFGGTVAGPAYQDIMQLALARYGVAPSKSKSPKLPVAPDAE